MSNPYPPPPEKMSTEEKLGVATGCGCLTISTAIWLGLMLLVVLALMKFVFG
jgi:uncharacterized protein (TIGR03382 family)